MSDEIVSGRAIVFAPERSLLIAEGGETFFEEVSSAAVDVSQMEADDLPVLVSHIPAHPVARLSAGNLALSRDRTALRATVAMPDVTWARDAATIIKRGIARGWSYGFNAIRDRWRMEAGTPVRTIEAMRVLELSMMVVWPAFPGTTQRTQRSVRGFELSGQMNEGREWARRLAATMRLLAKSYPDRDPRIVGYHDGTSLRWDLEWAAPRSRERSAYRPSVDLLRRKLRLAELA